MRMTLAASLSVFANLLLPVHAAVPVKTLVAQGHWAALKFGETCVAEARPLPAPGIRHGEARAGVTFAPRTGRHGEFHARLSSAPRAGSSVMLTIGERPFLLVSRGEWAWSRGAMQDQAIIAAVRNSRSMRIDTRDGQGRRRSDRYLLTGAPTAIDAAAAACAG